MPDRTSEVSRLAGPICCRLTARCERHGDERCVRVERSTCKLNAAESRILCCGKIRSSRHCNECKTQMRPDKTLHWSYLLIESLSDAWWTRGVFLSRFLHPALRIRPGFWIIGAIVRPRGASKRTSPGGKRQRPPIGGRLSCPSWGRTRTLLIQSQACCQLHQGAKSASQNTSEALLPT